MNEILVLYNFRTDQEEVRNEITTDEDARQYIPQDAIAQNLYTSRRGQGDSIYEALAWVTERYLEAQPGESE